MTIDPKIVTHWCNEWFLGEHLKGETMPHYIAQKAAEFGRLKGLEEAKKVLEDVETVKYTFGGETYDSVTETIVNAMDAIELLKDA
jgi:hypothetical protein